MPMLTEADPKVSAEGSIDPLGMYAIADALAVRMITAFRCGIGMPSSVSMGLRSTL